MHNNKFKKTVKPWVKRLAAIGTYVLYLAIVLEVAARIVLAAPFLYDRIIKEEYFSDVTWRHRWIRSHRDDRAKSRLTHSFWQHDPLRGWSLKPNYKDTTYYKNRTVTTNSRGIRGTTEYTFEKTPATKRIVVIGESFTFGSEVSDEETYPHHLQQMLPDTEVINLGVGGYGYDQMLLTLKEVGIRYQPDIVVIAYLDIDKKRNMLSFRDYAKPRYKLRNNELILTNVPVPSPEQILKKEIWRSKLNDIVNLIRHKFKLKSGMYEQEEKELSQAILEDLVATTRSINATPVIAYLEGIREPVRSVEMPPATKEFITDWYNKKVYCINLLPYIMQADAEFYRSLGRQGKPFVRVRKYQHFNPRENHIIGYGISDFLKKYKLI